MFGTRSKFGKPNQELKRLLKPNGTLIIAVQISNPRCKHYGKFWALMMCHSFWHFLKAIKMLFEKKMKLVKVL
jgi:hypothetical protein